MMPKVLYNGPLVVLTNRFSASASEIFAAQYKITNVA
ncbi:MAG: S41 family peptidase [Bacteroidota bacterium]